MKLLFVTGAPVAFTVETPGQTALGGTESCAAYLCRQLAANGHDVTLMAQLPDGTPERVMGVRHVFYPAPAADAAFFAAQDFEAVVALSMPGQAASLQALAPRAFHAAWLHMLPNQSNMAPLSQAARFIDCAVLLSETQRKALRVGGPAQVIGNGIAPAFEDMFDTAADLRAAKRDRAAYTSMPFRGLNVLAPAFAKARIETQLDVYSGMSAYQQSDDAFAPLYAQLRATPRVRCHGAVGQSALAAALKPAAFLAYPCTFAETYCIVALEAIAAGLKVLATDLGALPETTLGFAELLPATPDPAQLIAPFAMGLEKMVEDFHARPREWAEERFEQSQTVNRLCNWRARAAEWEALLGPGIAWKRGA